MSHQLNRRSFLQVGYSGLLGLGLSSLLEGRPAAASERTGRAKSVIIVFLTGAPSHLDMFDMKPDAPAEIRGEFKPIATSVPGVHVSEHLPRLAARADKYAIVRTLSHRDNNHLVATHHTLTGQQQPGAFFDKIASRDDWPSYASALDYLRPRSDGIPSGVNLPTFLMEGPLVWPGQHAGILGPRHDPWQITRDPNLPNFGMDSLRPAEGLDVTRLNDRRGLLQEIDAQQRELTRTQAAVRLSDQQNLAYSILASGRIAGAFNLDQEPAAVRDRYGRHAFGQSLLLARRLVQAGVPVVQANMGRVQNWDSHSNIFGTLKNRLVPPLDMGVSALLDDLEATGLLDDTLVMMLGEFGRTPRVFATGANAIPGRDHWAPCYFGVFAGAGVRGGQVIGRSDRIGAFPATPPFSPNDVGATVYHTLGINPHIEVRDRQNRPVTLNRGEVMQALFSALGVSWTAIIQRMVRLQLGETVNGRRLFVLTVFATLFVAVVLLGFFGSQRDPVNLINLKRIQPGMSKEDVVAVFARPADSFEDEVFRWHNKARIASIIVTFDHGQVVEREFFDGSEFEETPNICERCLRWLGL